MIEETKRYVFGFVCKCGELWPETDPFEPFLPAAPKICPFCGIPKEQMERRAIIEIRWETGWWIFKTCHVKYETGLKL